MNKDVTNLIKDSTSTYFSDEEYTSLDSDNKELLRMLASIVKNSKKED